MKQGLIMQGAVGWVPGAEMSPCALGEGHSRGPPSPAGIMEFRVVGQCSNRSGTRSCGDRTRNDQHKLQGMGDSSKFPQERWLALSQALKDTEVLNQVGKREPQKHVHVQLFIEHLL